VITNISQEKDSLSFIILALTAKIDNYFDPRESEVIKEYSSFVNLSIDLVSHLVNVIDVLPSQEYEHHLTSTAKEYAKIATMDERNRLLEYTLKLIQADNVIHPSESIAFSLIYKILKTNKML